jgi:hypothetical protein
MESALDRALDTVELLQEAVRLPHGYWVPAPIRAIDLQDGLSLLIAPHPTPELRRHFPSIRIAGAGRLVDTGQVAGLPRQSFASWLDEQPLAADAWLWPLIRVAKSRLSPSVAVEGMTAFSVSNSRNKYKSPNSPLWLDWKAGNALRLDGVGLFRSHIGGTRYRYFWGRTTASGKFLEGPAALQPLRVQYALANAVGQPLSFKIVQRLDGFSLQLPLYPPKYLRRALVAFLNPAPLSTGYKWESGDKRLLAHIRSLLIQLACEEARNE